MTVLCSTGAIELQWGGSHTEGLQTSQDVTKNLASSFKDVSVGAFDVADKCSPCSLDYVRSLTGAGRCPASRATRRRGDARVTHRR